MMELLDNFIVPTRTKRCNQNEDQLCLDLVLYCLIHNHALPAIVRVSC
jgi:hypothetical protein